MQVPAYRKLVAEARQQQQEQEQAEQPPGGSAGSDAAAEGGECRASTPGASSQSEEDAAPCPAWDQVPFWTKEQYIQRYLLPERCTGGSLAAADFVHESSGSSGQPTLWARNCFDELAVCDRCGAGGRQAGAGTAKVEAMASSSAVAHGGMHVGWGTSEAG